MSSNRLKLDVDKTQFIWLGGPTAIALDGPRQLLQVSSVELPDDGVRVSAVDTVRDLEVSLDAQLSVESNVDSIERSYNSCSQFGVRF